jgi:hypothetical protein
MDCCIKKTTLDQKTLEQNGYGFLHYSLDEEGIQSALQASRTIKQIHIQNVLYDCSLTWSVDAMLKQRGELQQQEPSRPLLFPEAQQPKELFIPSGASSNAMFLPPAAVLPDDFDFGELVYKKPPVAPHPQQQHHHHHHQFPSAHQTRHYQHQHQPLQPQPPVHHLPTFHFPKQHYQPPQQPHHLVHHSNQYHHPHGITPSRSLSDPSGRLFGQPMPPAHQHHHYHHQQQPKILTTTLNSPSLSHNNNPNNVFGLSNSHFLAPNLVINSEPPSPAYLTSALATSPSYNPFALSSVSEISTNSNNNHEKNSFGLEVQAPDDNMNYSLSPSPEKSHHSAAAALPLRSFASYIPDSSFKTYGDVHPSDISDYPMNNSNDNNSFASFSPPPSPTKQYSPKYSSNK